MDTDPSSVVIFDEKLLEEEQYWIEKLDGKPVISPLLADYSRPLTQGYLSDIVEIAIPPQTTQKLLQLSADSLFLLYVALLASLKTCLHKYCGSESIIVGSPTPRESGITNALVTIDTVSEEMTFRQLLLSVRETLLADYARLRYPFSRLARKLGMAETEDRCPLFDIALELQPFHNALPLVKNDITITLALQKEDLSGQVRFNSTFFMRSTLEHLIDHWLSLLQSALEDVNVPIRDLTLFARDERDKLLKDWNATQSAFPADACIHSLFEARVQQTPQAPAVLYKSTRLTYTQVNAYANQLGHYLQSLGIGPEKTVGIFLERSPNLVIGMFGILKAGGAYLPLDPNYSVDRLAFMLADAHVHMLITQQSLLQKLPEYPGQVICLDTDWEKIAHESSTDVMSSVCPENLAYVIYTSGSTGQPKGVLLEHRGRVNNIFDLNQRFHVSSQDCLLALSSLSFDMTVYDICGILAAGGSVVLPTEVEEQDPMQWASLMIKYKVSIWQSVPALCEMLVSFINDHPEAVPRFLRLVLLGGDWIPVALPERLMSLIDKLEVISLGGATEASVHSTIYPVRKSNPNWKSIPYGQPMQNQTCHVLDAHLQPVPIGIAGELCLGGVGLARGYLHHPDLTAEKFIPHPFASEPGQRLYRTGDLARYLPDGNLELLGRIDYQVKIRGYRIEPGEIEATLQKHPAIREAVILVQGDQPGDKRLVAYLVPDEKCAFTIRQLLRFEREGVFASHSLGQLPNSMSIVQQNQGETDYLYQEIFEASTYQRHGIILPEGACVFDVGANIGLFTLFIHRLCETAVVYAFEPIPPIYELLRINTALYGVRSHVFANGLSNEAAVGTFTYYPHLSLLSGRYADVAREREAVKAFEIRKQFSQETAGNQWNEALLDELLTEQLVKEDFVCPLTTISAIIREQNIERIDLLKIDTERSELDVLAGIQNDDWQKIKQLIVEVHEINGQVEQVVMLLKNRGYSVDVEKEALLQDLNIYNVYAVQPSQTWQHSIASKSDSSVSWHNKAALISDIRDYVQSQLPAPMVPQTYVLLEELPLTPNGKIDRQKLALLGRSKSREENTIRTPRTPFEEVLVAIWSDVLKRHSIGIDDNFFAIGGHSLLATQIMSRVRDVFQLDLPLRTLFQAPTVVELAKRILEAGEATGIDTAGVAQIVSQLNRLSDDEVKAMLAEHHAKQ